MKKGFVISLMAVLALAGCQTRELDYAPQQESKHFTATIEDDFNSGDTRTYMDENGNVRWKQGDQVSIFAGSTVNEQYQVTDASDGKTSAGFNKVSGGGFVGGGEIDNNVAFYPYASTAEIAKSGDAYVISDITLPATQNYAEASFGNGAFPMAAVTSNTDDMHLKFKNVLGGLKLQLKGTASIASISITGNQNEVLCGAAAVTVSNGSAPSINLTDATAKTVTLNCGVGVQLNAETATAFVIALPPMTMEGGFTVVVTDTEGKQMEIKTTKTQTINRSKLLKMPAVNYVGTAVIDYAAEPFTINSIESTTVTIQKWGSIESIELEYKKGTDNWSPYAINSAIDLADGETLQFRAGPEGNASLGTDNIYDGYRVYVTGTGRISVSGNIMSLLDRDLQSLSVGPYAFSYLFRLCYDRLVDVSNLILPATSLAEGCYKGMFTECSKITIPPELPATNLVASCYQEMFTSTGLTIAPELPATYLAPSCYRGMFAGTSLTIAPELPATTLADHCYYRMFSGCESLTTAPDLPATSLVTSCYEEMFYDCSSLITPPELPATTLAEMCYQAMFYYCTSLSAAPDLPATTLADHCYYRMFSDCSSLTKTPSILPATTLVPSCYQEMFARCTSLTSVASILPATTLAEMCYQGMFRECKSLTTVPTLPATTLAKQCYTAMFVSCQNLTIAPELPATSLADYCYAGMFYGCTGLTTAPELPAIILTKGCYEEMFSRCTSLITTPELPATIQAEECYQDMFSGCTSLTSVSEISGTTLAKYCYRRMFKDCTSLTEAPDFIATTLADYCCLEMFSGCTSLVSAPSILPATTLSSTNYCYNRMFYGCTSLTTPPVLPATTLAYGCYMEMFYNCSSLTSAPELPATTLVGGCYSRMFKGCSNLSYVKALFTTHSVSYVSEWLGGVATTGTFVKNKDATWDVTGSSGIPTGWTVLTE